MTSAQIFIVVVSIPVVAGYASFSLLLLTVYRVLRLIRPEHRGVAPAAVWGCLVPLVGSAYAVWLVWATARGLRRQFIALGQHRPGASYGMTGGAMWAGGSLLVTAGVLVLCLPTAGLNDFGAMTIILGLMALGAVSIIGFAWHWGVMEVCRWRLEQHFPSAATQDELDFDDDLPKPPDGG